MGFAQGLMGYDADMGQAAAEDYNAKDAQIAGNQQADQRLTQLNSTISSVDAIRSARGLSVSSPTGLALSQYATKNADMNIATDQLNADQQQSSDLMQASADKSQAWSSLIGGLLTGGEQSSDAYNFGVDKGYFSDFLAAG